MDLSIRVVILLMGLFVNFYCNSMGGRKMKLLKYCLSVSKQRWVVLLVCLGFFAGVYGSLAWLVHAEGSSDLYPNGATGFRASIEWRDSSYGTFLRRRALFRVYAEAGEVILLGSSAISVPLDAGVLTTNAGDIRVYAPGSVTGNVGEETIVDPPAFSCNDQRTLTGNLDQGRISSRTQELAGPDTIIDTTTAARGNAVPAGYVPCFYEVTQTGVYYVVFWGPRGDGSNSQTNPLGSIPDIPENFNDYQDTSVSTWDITVRDAPDSISNTRTGRVFANYLALFTGDNPRPISSTLYVLTTDGYIYQTDLRGVDPNGFIIYANDVGFLNSDGTPLYRDIVGTTDQLDGLQGGVSLALPTHFIFLQEPDPATIAAIGVPLNPVAPQVDSIVFNGDLGGNDTTFGAGGTFVYTSNISGTYELIISQGTDFDPTNPQNRVLRGSRPSGMQSVVWDGSDNAGNRFPVGLNYPISITVRAGEYHFPLLDVENSQLGGPQYTLLNPPNGLCPSFYNSLPNCNIAFYDDRGYTTANGTNVGTPPNTLPGIGQPSPNRSDPLTGFDTTTNQRAFGTGGQFDFGDKKGLDLWTYYPSQPQAAFLNIFNFNLQLAKTDGGVTTAPGGTIVYTLTYTNTGLITATGVMITETVPDNTTFNQANSTGGWGCADGSLPGTPCVLTLSDVVSDTSGTVNFAVTVDDPLPSGTTSITNTAVIGDDGANGPEPDTTDNTANETTPLAIVDPRITKVADVSQARPGDAVNFSIVVFNPTPPSNVPATNVILTEPLPLEYDFITSTLVDPSGLASGPPIVTSTVVSLVGHPSGITQTIASTITVNIPVLGVSQAVTLNVAVQVNNLASPPPLNVINEATLSFNEGTPITSSASLDVPSPAPAPSPGGNEHKDKDKDNNNNNSSAAAAPSVPPAPVQPTPVLPVVYLPETGIGPTGAGSYSIGWGIFVIPGLSLIGLAIVYGWYKRERVK